jgi:hypothetical protein
MDIWRLILAVLGGVKMKNVSKARWDSFLASRTSWSPRTKSIAQQHYQRVLKYAVSVGALGAVHPLDKIEGANDRVLEPGDSLIEDEVVAVLRVACGLHRPLFAVAIGQGTRPGEVVILDWKDVDWARNMIRFQAFEGRKRIKGKNKKADRWVPMTEMTSDYLRELARGRQGSPSDTWIQVGTRPSRITWPNARSDLRIQSNTVCKVTPTTWKSQASPFMCWDVLEPPMYAFNRGQRYRLWSMTGRPNRARTGSSSPVHRAVTARHQLCDTALAVVVQGHLPDLLLGQNPGTGDGRAGCREGVTCDALLGQGAKHPVLGDDGQEPLTPGPEPGERVVALGLVQEAEGDREGGLPALPPDGLGVAGGRAALLGAGVLLLHEPGDRSPRGA